MYSDIFKISKNFMPILGNHITLSSEKSECAFNMSRVAFDIFAIFGLKKCNNDAMELMK